MLVSSLLVRTIEMNFRQCFVAVFITAVLVIVIAKLHLMQRLNSALFARDGVEGVGEDVGRLDDVAAMIADIWRRSANVSAAYDMAADIDALETLFELESAKKKTYKENSTRRVRYLKRVLTGTLEAVLVGSTSPTRVDSEKGDRWYLESAEVATALAVTVAARQRRLFVAERLTRLLSNGGHRILDEKLGKRQPTYLQVFDEQPSGLVGVFVYGL